MTPERQQNLTQARVYLAEINKSRKALRALQILPVDLDNITVIEKLEAKVADGIELDDTEQLVLGQARENLEGTYKRVSRPNAKSSIQPLPPMTPAQFQARAEADANDMTMGIHAMVENYGLNALNERLKADGQAPLSFELIQMQPPKPVGLVKLGFFATVARSIKLWWQARKERKLQLTKFQELLRKEYKALPPGELKDHKKAIDLAVGPFGKKDE